MYFNKRDKLGHAKSPRLSAHRTRIDSAGNCYPERQTARSETKFYRNSTFLKTYNGLLGSIFGFLQRAYRLEDWNDRKEMLPVVLGNHNRHEFHEMDIPMVRKMGTVVARIEPNSLRTMHHG